MARIATTSPGSIMPANRRSEEPWGGWPAKSLAIFIQLVKPFPYPNARGEPVIDDKLST